MPDEALRQATLGAASAQAPASPLGSFPELSKLYESSFQSLQSAAPTAARLNLASDTVSRQKAKKSNFQKVKRDDGGFGFYDGDGKELSAYEYATAMGKKPSEVLGDSENPIDIGYLQDYKNLQDYMEAKFNAGGNKKLADKAKQIEAAIKKQFGVDVGKMKPNDLIGQFKAAYPTVYGGNKAGVPVGRTFIPQAETGKTPTAAEKMIADLQSQYGVKVE